MIDILMSTFNGEAFLSPQLDSILEQGYRDFRLLVRDDGSTDGTLDIVREYAAIDPRVVIVGDGEGNLRAFASFMKLVVRSESEYFMFADQDDVWLPDRISKMLNRLVEIEKECGTSTPIVVFSDLIIADEGLNVIDDSLWHYSQFDPNICRSWRLLTAQNVVLGCALIANRAARNLSIPYRLPAMPHDQWVAVNAAKYGRIDFIRDATILYRQHSENHSGANRFRLGYALSRLPNSLNTGFAFRRAAQHFGDISTAGLIWRKFRLNIKRFRKRDQF